jgi:hypothetical protein
MSSLQSLAELPNQSPLIGCEVGLDALRVRRHYLDTSGSQAKKVQEPGAAAFPVTRERHPHLPQTAEPGNEITDSRIRHDRRFKRALHFVRDLALREPSVIIQVDELEPVGR